MPVRTVSTWLTQFERKSCVVAAVVAEDLQWLLLGVGGIECRLDRGILRHVAGPARRRTHPRGGGASHPQRGRRTDRRRSRACYGSPFELPDTVTPGHRVGRAGDYIETDDAQINTVVLVGATGFEPVTSSVSANSGEALCNSSFSQVAFNRRRQSYAFS